MISYSSTFQPNNLSTTPYVLVGQFRVNYFGNYKPNVVINPWNRIQFFTLAHKKVQLATIVEDDPKAPFSITTTPRCRGKALLIYLHCSTLLSIRTLLCWVLCKEVLRTIFWVFGMTRPGIEPLVSRIIGEHSPIRPMGRTSHFFLGIRGKMSASCGVTPREKLFSSSLWRRLLLLHESRPESVLTKIDRGDKILFIMGGTGVRYLHLYWPSLF